MTEVPIRNEREYRDGVKRVFELMIADPPPESPEGEELVRLAAAVEHFEAARYPFSCCAFAALEGASRVLDLMRKLSGTYDIDAAIRWCESPQVLLDGQRPVEMLMSRQGAEQVDAAVDQLRDGTHV